MPEGIYAAAAGMAAQQTRMDALSNDIANVNTTGYKSERLGFRDLMYAAEHGSSVGSGSAEVDMGRTASQGTLLETGDPLSVAISGPGYLQVRRADGSTALTRDGQLQIDADGALVTATGAHLQPPVTLPKGTDPKSISIAPDGTVNVAGKAVGKLSIVDVPAPGALLSGGDNLFVPTAASGAPAAIKGSTVVQGSVEASNVDMSQTMVDLIDAQRGYELASRAIQTQDQLLDIANQIVK